MHLSSMASQRLQLLIEQNILKNMPFKKKKKRNHFSFKNRRVEIIAVIICFYLGLNCSCENLFHCAFKYYATSNPVLMQHIDSLIG